MLWPGLFWQQISLFYDSTSHAGDAWFAPLRVLEQILRLRQITTWGRQYLPEAHLQEALR